MPLMLPTMLNGRGRKSTEQGSRYHWILSRCHWISCCPPAKPRLHREFESHAACILWFQRRMLDLALPLGQKVKTGPLGNEVATKCVLGASRSSAFDAPLSPSVPAGPQRCSGWHAGTRRALAVLAKFSGAALDRSRNDRAGICTAGR